MSKLPDLQSAVRRIEGVAAATVRWPDPHGPATLRVEFTGDADRRAVTEEVLATLREIAGVETSEVHVDLQTEATVAVQQAAEAARAMTEERATPPETAAPAEAAAADPGSMASRLVGRSPRGGGGVRHRPVFSGMKVDRGALDTHVQVTLAVGGSAYVGSAEGLATRRATTRTAADATLAALRELLPADSRVQLEWLEVIEGPEPGRPAVVQTAVTFLSREGEEIYVGSAIVRNDLHTAAVRATLDALNRVLFRWSDDALES